MQAFLPSRPFAKTSIALAVSVSLVLGLAACSSEDAPALIASARDHLAKHDLKGAEIQLKNALQKDPNLVEARVLLGQTLLEDQNPVAAVAELDKALALKAPQSQVVPSLAQALLEGSQERKLVDTWGATTLPDAHAQAMLKTAVATAWVRQGGMPQATAAVDAALAADPQYGPARLMKARMQGDRGDVDGAFAVVDSVLKERRWDAEALQLKGDLLLHVRRDGDAALAAYRGAIAAHADNPSAYAAIVSTQIWKSDLDGAEKALADLRKVRPNALTTRYLMALIAFERKDLKSARETLLQLLKVAPDNPKALELMGAVEFESHSLVQAEQQLGKALRMAPNLELARRLMAQTYIQLGQPAKALAVIQPLVEDPQATSTALSIAAAAALQSGDAKRAEALFARVLKLRPDDVQTRTSLALTRMGGAGGDSALADLRAIAAKDSGITADMALITVAVQRKDAAGALRAIDGLEKKTPKQPIAANLRGQVLLAQGDPAAARQAFERALTIAPNFYPAAEALGVLDVADGHPEAAQHRFEAMLAKDPKNSQAVLALAALLIKAKAPAAEVEARLAQASKLAPDDAEPKLMGIYYAIAQRKLDRAVDQAERAVAAAPENVALIDALGHAQIAAGQRNQAITTYTRLATLRPNSAEPQLRLADTYTAENQRDQAVAALKRALSIEPDSLPALRRLVAHQIGAGQQAEALATAQTMQQRHPNNATGYLFEGDIASSAKQWERAATAYRAALQRDANTETAQKLHIVLRTLNKSGEVSQLAAQWLRSHPKDAGFEFYLGNAALSESRWADAEASYKRVVELQPDNAAALNNVAWLRFRAKQADALDWAERANRARPDQPTFMDTLALILADRGQTDRALTLQKKAIELRPKNDQLYLTLAKIYLKSGQKDKAATELNRLAKLGDDFSGHAEVAELKRAL